MHVERILRLQNLGSNDSRMMIIDAINEYMPNNERAIHNSKFSNSYGVLPKVYI